MGAADGTVVVGVGGYDGGELYDGDADGEEAQGEPFRGTETLAEEEDGEGGGGEDFHLVGDLEGGDGEVADGDELEGVLDDVEEGGDGEFPAVGTEDVGVDLGEGVGPEGGGGGGRGEEGATDGGCDCLVPCV